MSSNVFAKISRKVISAALACSFISAQSLPASAQMWDAPQYPSILNEYPMFYSTPGYLPPGTPVYIPSSYHVSDPRSGSYAFEPTYVNWLQSAYMPFDSWGGVQDSYYLPVRVDYDSIERSSSYRRYEPRQNSGGYRSRYRSYRERSNLRREEIADLSLREAEPSSEESKDEESKPTESLKHLVRDLTPPTYYVKMDHLALIPGTKQLATTQATPLIEVKQSPKKNETAASSIPDCNCNDPFLDLKKDLTQITAAAEAHANGRREGSARNLTKPFTFPNCPAGFDSEKLRSLLQTQIDRPERKLPSGGKIPVAILLGMMENESAGNCSANNNESNGTRSVGLFQINSVNMGTHSPDEFKSPALSTQYAVKILSASAVDVYNRWKALGIGEPDPDILMRLALSAYSGGAGNAMMGVKDLLDFNKKNQDLKNVPNRDPNKWEDLKLFFFGKELKQRGLANKYHNKIQTTRSTGNAKINVAYIDTVMGTQKATAAPALAEQWNNRLGGSTSK